MLASGDLLGNPDGIVLDNSGRVYVAGYGSKHVVVVGSDGTIADLGFVPGGPDGVALARHKARSPGRSSSTSGTEQVVALAPDGSLMTLASGGTPGDLVAVDPEGHPT